VVTFAQRGLPMTPPPALERSHGGGGNGTSTDDVAGDDAAGERSPRAAAAAAAAAGRDEARRWLWTHVALGHSLLSGVLDCLVLARNGFRTPPAAEEGGTAMLLEGLGDAVGSSGDAATLGRAVAQVQALLDMLVEAAAELSTAPAAPAAAPRDPSTQTLPQGASSGGPGPAKKAPPAVPAVKGHASMRAAVLQRLNGMAGVGQAATASAPTRRGEGKGSALLAGAAVAPSPAAAAALVAAAQKLFAATSSSSSSSADDDDDASLPLLARFGALAVASHAAAEAAQAPAETPAEDGATALLPLLRALHAAYRAVCAVDVEDRWTDAAADTAEEGFLAANAIALATQADHGDDKLPAGSGRGGAPSPRKPSRSRATYAASFGANMTMLPVASGATSSSSSDEEEDDDHEGGHTARGDGNDEEEDGDGGGGCGVCGHVHVGACARRGAMAGRRVDVGIPFAPAPALPAAHRRPPPDQRPSDGTERDTAGDDPRASAVAQPRVPPPPPAALVWVAYRRLPPEVRACLDRPDMPSPTPAPATDPDAQTQARASSSASATASAAAADGPVTAPRRGLRGDALRRAVGRARDDAVDAARCALFALRCEVLWAATAAVRALPRALPGAPPPSGAWSEDAKWELLAYWSADLLRAVADGLTVRTLRAYVDLLQVTHTHTHTWPHARRRVPSLSSPRHHLCGVVAFLPFN